MQEKKNSYREMDSFLEIKLSESTKRYFQIKAMELSITFSTSL
jgi:hypothetical protein